MTVLLRAALYVDALKTAQSTGDRISKNDDLWQWFSSSRWLWCCYGNNWCRYVRELLRNVIRGKFCCQKPTISKELWITSLSCLLQKLSIRIRIVETCKIKTSREIKQIKIQLRSFSVEFIHWKKWKLAEDACYPEDVKGKFKNLKISSADDILPAYNLMLLIVKSFNADPEIFYSQFYEVFSSIESLYKNLSGNCNLLLSFEVAYYVLAKLTGAIT